MLFRLFIALFLFSSAFCEDAVFMGIVVKDYDQLLPFFLRTIEKLDFNKKQLHVQFDVCHERVDRVLAEWVEKNKADYLSATFVHHSGQQGQQEQNKYCGEIKNGYLSKAKILSCEHCFILSSDVFLLPRTLKHLVAQNKPIIAPLLRAIPEAKDPFRNFFAAITDNGYYKSHPDYDPIANRYTLGTFKVPCVHGAYLIKTSLGNRLSFTKNFLDWEFLAFAKNARENAIDQYICNEKEFGSFLHFYKEMSVEEQQSFNLTGTEFEITPSLFHTLLAQHFAEDPHLKEYAENFNFQDYAIYRIENKDLFYLDEVNDYIKSYVLKQGLRFEESIHDQFKKYARPGSTVLDIGGHIGIHTLNLSRIVGDKGRVYVFEPQAKMFCELAVNMHLNDCKNVSLYHNALGEEEKWIEMYIPKEEWTEQFGKTLINEGHGTVRESFANTTGDRAKMIRLDSFHLDNVSFIKMDVEGAEMEVILGGLDTILRNKPVMIIEMFQNSQLQKKLKTVEDLGYTSLPLGMDNYLFIPTHNVSLKKTVLPKKDIYVTWEGSFSDLDSLSNVNRSLTQKLAEIPHVHLSRISTNLGRDIEHPDIKKILPLLQATLPSDPMVTVRHAWPPSWIPPSKGKWVLIQPWEFGALPADWIPHLANVDEIWVPTTFVKNTYVYSGISEDKVKVVPNGYNPAIFHPEGKRYALNTDKKFKFLYIGGTIYRKGSDLLLKSYQEAFKSKDDVCLVIKDFGAKSWYAGQTNGEKIKVASSVNDSPEIIYLDNDLSSEEIASLYRACDCLVYPYRGEGFALPVLEAMACGLPVVVTSGGATNDFVTSDCGWFISASINSIGSKLGSTNLIKDGWLLEPNTDMLAKLLRKLYENPFEVRAKGLMAQQHAKEWTWEKAAAIAADRLCVLTQ